MPKTLDRKVLRTPDNPLQELLEKGSKRIAKTQKELLRDEIAENKSRGFVSWTEDEKRIFATVLFEELLLRPRVKLREVIEAAVLRVAKENLIPQDRRRKATGLYQSYTTGGFDAYLIEFGGLSIDAIRARNRQHSSVTKDPLDLLTDDEIMVRFGKRVLDNLTPHEVISGFTTDELLSLIPTPDLAAAFAKRMVTDLLNREIKLTQHVRHEVPVNGHNGNGHNGNGHNGNGHNGSRVNRMLPHVAVVGANSDQYSRIIGEFDGRATFLHVEPRRIETAPLETADRVVVWGDYCSSQQKRITRNRMKAAKCAEQLVIHHGGYNQLITILDGLLSP